MRLPFELICSLKPSLTVAHPASGQPGLIQFASLPFPDGAPRHPFSEAQRGSGTLRLRRKIPLLFEEESLKTACFDSYVLKTGS
jgi:hypothetical protein